MKIFRARLAVLGPSGKLATDVWRRHKRQMRVLIPAALLFVAACAPRPAPTSVPAQPAEPSIAETANAHDHRTLNGMTANELVQHFGRPRLQIQEGQSTKLQFAGTNCVLDFYLYPGQGGTPRVAHIDARNAQGADVNAQACVYQIESARGAR